MVKNSLYSQWLNALNSGDKNLAVLIDPDKFIEGEASIFLKDLPVEVSHILVGGSTDKLFRTEAVVKAIKAETDLPVVLFPGDYSQITETADAILFLSLLSGRNPEYLIGQQIKSIVKLRNSGLEIIPTGYILVDGGKKCAVERVSGTKPISQDDVDLIVNTAIAGQYLGKALIYLEAGSGAPFPVSLKIVSAVKEAINIPLIVGGGIKSQKQMQETYDAGADVVVVGTAFEKKEFLVLAENKYGKNNF